MVARSRGVRFEEFDPGTGTRLFPLGQRAGGSKDVRMSTEALNDVVRWLGFRWTHDYLKALHSGRRIFRRAKRVAPKKG